MSTVTNARTTLFSRPFDPDLGFARRVQPDAYQPWLAADLTVLYILLVLATVGVEGNLDLFAAPGADDPGLAIETATWFQLRLWSFAVIERWVRHIVSRGYGRFKLTGVANPGPGEHPAGPSFRIPSVRTGSGIDYTTI
jgi:hypothetical protein